MYVKLTTKIYRALYTTDTSFRCMIKLILLIIQLSFSGKGLRGDIKISMSDKKLNSRNFLFEPTSPPPLKTKVTKIEKFCNVSVNTYDLDCIKPR